MAFRVDFGVGTLRNIETTPQGGIRAPGIVTRHGVLVYTVDGRQMREYRPPEEVYKPESLATLRNAPVTHNHPMEGNRFVRVGPENFQKFSVGYLAGEATKEDEGVAAELVVQGEAGIQAIQGGERELSCGYHCDHEETPGVTDDGEAYDRIQRNIRYNHVAIVPDGRAGPSVRLRIDSADDVVSDDDPATEKTNGETIMTPEQIQALIEEKAALAVKLEQAEARVKQLETELAGTQAKVDETVEEKEKVDNELKEATDPERVDAMVELRASIIERARPLLPSDYVFRGKKNRQIQEDALKAKNATFKADASDDYVMARFDAATEQRSPSAGNLDDFRRNVQGARVSGGERHDSRDDTPAGARARMQARHREASTGKLAYSKD